MTKRFEKAYNALYNAFMNGTLAKGECVACAVGNIVADGLGAKIQTRYLSVAKGLMTLFDCNENNYFWGTLFSTNGGEQERRNSSSVSYQRYEEMSQELYEITGYTEDELAKVEFAFETNTKINGIFYARHSDKEIMEDQFNGLMAVMDVLIALDEVQEGNQYKETFKNKFQTV